MSEVVTLRAILHAWDLIQVVGGSLWVTNWLILTSFWAPTPNCISLALWGKGSKSKACYLLRPVVEKALAPGRCFTEQLALPFVLRGLLYPTVARF